MPTETVLEHWIGGQGVASTGTGATASLNPSEPADQVALAPNGSQADVDRAVDAAGAAFPSWSRTSGPARADALYQWSDQIQTRHEELSQAVARELGKPIGEARGEVSRCVAILRYYAGECVRSLGEVVPALSSGPLQYSKRVPLGPVGLITPWNFPLAIPLWKAAPALAMGNTVVLKPAEQSPWCAHLLASTANGLPPGVFNVVFGDGAIVGQALTSHQGIRAVSFTGSVAVGSMVQAACAARNTKCQTEMGGKNAAVVLRDADLVRAANLVAGGAMRFAGQKCTATSRVIVDRAVHAAFMAELSAAIDALAVGAVTEAATAVGPVIEEESQKRLLEAIAAEPGRPAYQSSRACPGFYVPPTVFDDVDPSSELAQEELFGPVLAVILADGTDQAIEFANDTWFGLSTAVYTRDLASAMSFIDQIEAGMVRVNGDTTGVDPHAPFGGTKASSSGTREQGSVAKDFYSEWRTVQINP